MSDSSKRRKRENSSDVMVQFKQKYLPFIGPIHADDSEYCFGVLGHNGSGNETLVKGLLRVNDTVLEKCGNDDRVIVVDVKKKEVLAVEGVDLGGLKHNEIVDLNVDGERWEGDVLNDEPCGWGVVYDKNNRMVYEGFRVGEANVCYGVVYFSDISVVEYEGEWCGGKRWGRGTQYDRNGCVVFKGEWVNDTHLERKVGITPGNDSLIHNHIEVLVVSNGCKSWSLGSFDLSGVTYLKELRIGDECFNSVNEFKLIGLKYLETVMIGKKSFSISEKGKDYNRRFYVKNCPRLKTLNIGYRSFSDYKVIEIESVDALESLRIGDDSRYSSNFYGASLELRSVFGVMK